MDRELSNSEKLTARVVGLIALIGGIALGALMVWMIFKLMNLSRPPAMGALIFIGVVTPLALFLVNVGARMAMNKPNAYGSILTPIVWAALGVIFILGSILFVYMEFQFKGSGMLEAIVSSLLLGAACIYKAYEVNKAKNV